LDARKFIKKEFKLYRLKLSNDNPLFLNLKVNKKETFYDQANQGRRPRINFPEIYKQLESKMELIFDSKIKDRII
jgi:hypothetical protein